jgi:hypothetical protein
MSGQISPMLNDLGDFEGRNLAAEQICHLKTDV